MKKDSAELGLKQTAQSSSTPSPTSLTNVVGEKYDDEPNRDKWQTKIDFLITTISFAVGLGNVWRFPYLCYTNGGGAFLIPYFLSVIVVGIPLFLLEVTIGQMTSRGATLAWNICPLFQGIGFASALVVYIGHTYYAVILAWGVYYLVASFNPSPAWSHCDHAWSSPLCRDNFSTAAKVAAAANASVIKTIDPATNYWEKRVINVSAGITEVGNIQWELAACLFVTWLLVYIVVCMGIKTSRKVLYFTASGPYLFMVILLIRTAMLEGAWDGIRHYLIPVWSKLLDKKVWTDGGTQVFFSNGFGVGALIALGSYNRFHHNSFRDCLVFTSVNSLTSLVAGFIIFATLGHMAHVQQVDISKVAEQGPGLAFVTYPMALSTMPFSSFWCVCFFLMLLLLGIDSMFASVEGLIVSIADLFPSIHTSRKRRALVLACTTLGAFSIGLTMVTNGGMYVFKLFDYYSGSRVRLLIAVLELVVAGYIFGAKRLTKIMQKMYGCNLRWAPALFWCFITPVFTLILLLFSVTSKRELKYIRRTIPEPYQYPDWTIQLGWIISMLGLLIIPLVGIIRLLGAKGSFIQRLKSLLRPQWSDYIMARLNVDDDDVGFDGGKSVGKELTCLKRERQWTIED